MFYRMNINDHIRVPPDLFGLEVKDAVVKRIKRKYEGFISKDLGVVIDVKDVKTIGEGVIIPGDGASYYDTTFELLTFKPERALSRMIMREIVGQRHIKSNVVKDGLYI